MSQLVGLHNGVDQTKNTVLRPPILTVTPSAYPNGRIFAPANANYAQQTVQVTDDIGNGASHVRIVNGGYRTVYRVINVALNGDAIHTVRLVNNVGSGTFGFSRIDGYGAPAGFLKLLNDRDQTDVFILSPGMSIGVDPNMHRISFQGSGCDVGSYAVISYAMEIYMANVIFDILPSAGDLLSFGDFALFEVYANGHPETVVAGRFGVELPLSGLIADFCDNLVAAFNSDYIGAIAPAGSQTPFHWAKKLTNDDLVYMKDSGSSSWIIATDRGVQFCSTDAAMIRNVAGSVTAPSLQISKQL